MKTKSEQYRQQIRNRHLQQYFQKARQLQPSHQPIDIQLSQQNEKPTKPQKSWGYLFDQFKNFSNLNTLTQIYNQLHYEQYQGLHQAIVETMVRKIIQELEYQVLVHASITDKFMEEDREAIIIMLVLIYKELDGFMRCTDQETQTTMKSFNQKIVELISMMNLRDIVKNNLRMNRLKQLTY